MIEYSLSDQGRLVLLDKGLDAFFMDPVSFIKEVRIELNKVAWPSRAEIIRMTGLVIIVSVFVGLYIGLIDITLAKLLETIIK